MYGDASGITNYEGVIPKMERLYHETESEYIREEISKYMTEIVCPKCNGARLRKEALSIKIAGKNIYEVCLMSAKESIKFFKSLPQKISQKDKTIAKPLLREILKRLRFLIDVGVEYINLAREATTLSVGENQRIRLACQLGSGLSGVVYVLDEPTIGLHQRDIERLIKALKQLVEQCTDCTLFENPKECEFFRKEMRRVFNLDVEDMDLQEILESNIDNMRSAATCVHSNFNKSRW